MHLFRQLITIFVLICGIVGSNAVVNANDPPRYNPMRYVPTPMVSVDAAIAAIKELKGFMTLEGGYPPRDLSVDQLGLSVLAVKEGVRQEETKSWIGWDRITIPNNIPYREEHLWSVEFNKVTSLVLVDHGPNTNSWAVVQPYRIANFDNVAHARKFIDAVVTLALAQNAVLDPYYAFMSYDFSVYITAEHIKKVLRAANVPAGAVVFSADKSEAGREFMPDDVIVQATFGERVFPIRNIETWNAACREAVAGKPNATVLAKIIRNGVTIEKEVKVSNVGFGYKVVKSELTGAQAQSSPPPQGFGISLRPLEAEETTAMGLANANGFMVLSIANGSKAEKMQIKPNDVLLAINGTDITSTAKLQELMTSGPVTSVKVFRAGTASTLQAPLVF